MDNTYIRTHGIPVDRNTVDRVVDVVRDDLDIGIDVVIEFYTSNGESYHGAMYDDTATPRIVVIYDRHWVVTLAHELWHVHEYVSRVPYNEQHAETYGNDVAEFIAHG